MKAEERAEAGPAGPRRLRVLIANEQDERLERVADEVERLGHDVVARSLDPQAVGALTRETRADVSLVGVGLGGAHALELIDEIVREAACPVLALLDARDPSYVDEAAAHGIFGYVVIGGDLDDLRSAIDVALRRFADLDRLRGAFERRAIIEQAKGILMARGGLDADRAFALLRLHSRQTGQRLVNVAESVTRAHALLPSARRPEDA